MEAFRKTDGCFVQSTGDLEKSLEAAVKGDVTLVKDDADSVKKLLEEI
jgi:hypothetical protein